MTNLSLFRKRHTRTIVLIASILGMTIGPLGSIANEVDFLFFAKQKFFTQDDDTGSRPDDRFEPFGVNGFLEEVTPGLISTSPLPTLTLLDGSQQPTSTVLEFELYDGDFEIEEDLDTLDLLDAAAPDGTYQLKYTRSSDSVVVTGELDMVGGRTAYPSGPSLTASSYNNLQSVDLSAGFTLTWDAFTIDGVAPGSEDMIVIFAEPCSDGGDVDLVGPGELGGDATSFTVPAGVLLAGTEYEICILFINIVDQNTTDFGDGFAVAAYVSETCILIGSCSFDFLGFSFDQGDKYFGQPSNSTVTATVNFPVSHRYWLQWGFNQDAANFPDKSTVTFQGPTGSPFETVTVANDFFGPSSGFGWGNYSTVAKNLPTNATDMDTYRVFVDGQETLSRNIDAVGLINSALVIVPTVNLNPDNTIDTVTWAYFTTDGQPASDTSSIDGVYYNIWSNSGSLDEDFSLPGSTQSLDLSSKLIAWDSVHNISIGYNMRSGNVNAWFGTNDPGSNGDGTDAQNFNIRKLVDYEQTDNNAPTFVGAGFSAEVNTHNPGSITDFSVSPVTGNEMSDIGGGRSEIYEDFSSESLLNAAYPDGVYELFITGVNDGQVQVSLNLSPDGTQNDRSFPNAPHLTNDFTSLQNIDSTIPLELQWDAFSFPNGGSLEPNDFIRIEIYNASDEMVFEREINADQTSTFIDTDIFEPESNYALEIAFLHTVDDNDSNQDGIDDEYAGAFGSAFYVAYTFLEIRTGVRVVGDINEVYVAKARLYEQTSETAPTTTTGGFFFVDLESNGVNVITAASLTPPGKSSVSLSPEPGESDFWIFERSFSNEPDRETDFPDRTGYVVTVDTINNTGITYTVDLATPSFPGPVYITNYTAAQSIDSTIGFNFYWGPSTYDFIGVELMDDETGFYIDDDDFVYFSNNSGVAIPGNTLDPGKTYTLEIFAINTESLFSQNGTLVASAWETLTSLQVTTNNPLPADALSFSLKKLLVYEKMDDGAPIPNFGRLFAWVNARESGLMQDFSLAPNTGNLESGTAGTISFLNEVFNDESALDTAYPDGSYSVTITGQNDGPVTVGLDLLADGDNNDRRYPSPPIIHNIFNDLQNLDPLQSFTVSWDSIAYPNGDSWQAADSIWVRIRDDNGDIIYFKIMTPDSTSLEIGAETLLSNASYSLSVQHIHDVDFNTVDYPGVFGGSAFATVTTVDIQTGMGMDYVDITDVFLSKARVFEQTDDNAPSVVTGAFFFAELESFEDDFITAATVTPPGGSPIALTEIPDEPDAWELIRGFATETERDSAFPNAAGYIITVDTLNDTGLTFSLDLTTPNFPDPIHVTNFQDTQAISTGRDFTVLVSDTGQMYVDLELMDTSTGEYVDDWQFIHLPNSEGVTIPADSLDPGRTYDVEIFRMNSETSEFIDGTYRTSGWESLTILQFHTRPGVSYDDWAADNISNAGDRGHDLDPGNNGFSNFGDFVLGLDPLSGRRDNHVRTDWENDTLIITHRRGVDLGGVGINYEITDISLTSGWGTRDPNRKTVTPGDDDHDIVRAEFDLPTGTPQAFGRLNLFEDIRGPVQ